jgi:cytochrome P450/nitrite reductase/ring-hydroxylating ferredoxin subunit
MASDHWRRVATSTDVVAERPCGLSADGVELVVLRTRTGVRAYEGRCPHQGALLAEGSLDGDVLTCRNHGWRFDIETGRRLDGPECLRACPVREKDNGIFVEVPSREPSAPDPSKLSSLRCVQDLPGPRGVPLLGNLLQIDVSRLHTLLEGWAAEHGSVYQVRFGPRRIVVISDRTIADHVLRARPESFRRFHTFESVAAELDMVGVFTAEGEMWRRLRKLAMAALSTRHLPEFYPIIRTIAGRIRERWKRTAASGAVVDVAEEFKRFAIDITTWLAFGRDVNTVEGKTDVIERYLGIMFPIFHRRVVAALPYWRFVRLPSDRRFDRALSELRSWVAEVIAATRARLQSEPERAQVPSNFLEAMLAARDDDGRPFPDEVLFGSAMTMLIAGEDTTSTSLAWTVYHVSANPQALARLRAEADAVLGSQLVPDSAESAQRLTYAAAAVNESLRLSPVVPLLYLETNDDAILGDVRVPKATPVFLLTRPSVRKGQFGAASEFRPERWLEGERGTLVHDQAAHIPFGSGPRLCPGRSLATLESRVALATLVKSFDIERVGEDVVERYTSVMVPHGLHVRLHARKAPTQSPSHG